MKRAILKVKPGLSVGGRSRLVATLGAIIDKQLLFSQQGLDDVIVSIDGFYAALMDWARAAEVAQPEQYFLDPRSEESQKALQRKREEQQKKQQGEAKLIDQALGLEQLRTAFDKYKQDTDLTFKYWAGNLTSEVEEAKIIGAATMALTLARDKPEGEGNGKADEQGEADKASQGAT